MYRRLLYWLTGAFFIGAAVAADEQRFDRLDANKDGTITAPEAELSRGLMESWPLVDTNQDGVVDQSEFSAFEARQRRTTL